MIPIIRAFRNLLTNNLSHAQIVQFHFEIIAALSPIVEMIVALSLVWPKYKETFERLESIFKPNRKMFETQFISQKDDERDFTVRSIVAKIGYYYSYAQTPEEKVDSTTLKFITDTYKHSDSKEYETETAVLRNLIAELRKWPALLAKFGLTELVDRLDAENTDFETWYNERTVEISAKHSEGNMKILRRKVNSTFADVCKVIEGEILTPIDPDLMEKYLEIILIINSRIEDLTTIRNRHVGTFKAQKKKKEEAKKEEKTNDKEAMPDKKVINKKDAAKGEKDAKPADEKDKTDGDKGPEQKADA